MNPESLSSVILVGLPGSGKSTVGRLLAKRLGMAFYDSDQVIEQRIGCAIRDFFEREGEEAFRDVEQSVLTQLLQPGARCVISTGGGSVIRAENRVAMQKAGLVVYLKALPDEIYKRLRHDKSRPLLQVADPLGKLRDLHTVRDPLYREAAHYVLETGRPSIGRLVHMIAMQMELSQ